jgi:hypothetical protein
MFSGFGLKIKTGQWIYVGNYDNHRINGIGKKYFMTAG